MRVVPDDPSFRIAQWELERGKIRSSRTGEVNACRGILATDG